MNTTLRETDIAPENLWLEEEISLCEGLFSGAMLVLRSVGWKDMNHVYNFTRHSDEKGVSILYYVTSELPNTLLKRCRLIFSHSLIGKIWDRPLRWRWHLLRRPNSVGSFVSSPGGKRSKVQRQSEMFFPWKKTRELQDIDLLIPGSTFIFRVTPALWTKKK